MSVTNAVMTMMQSTRSSTLPGTQKVPVILGKVPCAGSVALCRAMLVTKDDFLVAVQFQLEPHVQAGQAIALLEKKYGAATERGTRDIVCRHSTPTSDGVTGYDGLPVREYESTPRVLYAYWALQNLVVTLNQSCSDTDVEVRTRMYQQMLEDQAGRR